MLCDAGYPTYLLGTWVREHEILTLEGRAAPDVGSGRFLRNQDRGRLEPGIGRRHRHLRSRTIGSENRGERRYDLPGGAKRMVMPSRGVEYTIVNGAVTWEQGRVTRPRRARCCEGN